MISAMWFAWTKALTRADLSIDRSERQPCGRCTSYITIRAMSERRNEGTHRT